MDAYISSIMGWGPTWAPRNWTLCAGQLLAISQFTAVFSLIGTIYGGDGRTTFRLPDLRARVPVAAGQSPGTQFIAQGSLIGSDTNTLTVLEMPVHNHSASLSGLFVSIPATTNEADSDTPASNRVLAQGNVADGFDSKPAKLYAPSGQTDTTLAPGSVTGSIFIGNAGGSQSFSIVQPLQAIQFIFCLQGIFPPRN